MITEYLNSFKQEQRFELKKFGDDKFDSARDMYVKCCEHVCKGWKDFNPSITDEIVKYSICHSKSKLDTSKGLILVGSTGVGKTVYLKALALMFGYSNRFRFNIRTGWEIERIYQLEISSTERYTLENDLKSKMFGIDDIGEEHTSIKVYGTEMNVGIEVITLRHLEYVNHGYLTYATTNLNMEMIAKKYGQRIQSRMHEMFNIIPIAGNDLRKAR